RAYLRISNEKIRRIDAIKHPNYFLILDESLLKYPNIKSLIDDTIVILNTEKSEDYQLPSNVEIYKVPATQIAIDLDLKVAGQPIVNVAMIGAFAKASGLISLESIKKVITDHFGAKGEKNYEAAKRAYDMTEKMTRGN
ncbi:MAG: 2-oxoacid:acceptor oxidoreductase family protein, partial [Candidatus Hodarchaeota archaeon]